MPCKRVTKEVFPALAIPVIMIWMTFSSVSRSTPESSVRHNWHGNQLLRSSYIVALFGLLLLILEVERSKIGNSQFVYELNTMFCICKLPCKFPEHSFCCNTSNCPSRSTEWFAHNIRTFWQLYRTCLRALPDGNTLRTKSSGDFGFQSTLAHREYIKNGSISSSSFSSKITGCSNTHQCLL